MNFTHRSTHCISLSRLSSAAFFALLVLIGLQHGSKPAAAAESGIVINEIHFDPADKTKPQEYIELFNSGTAELNLAGWRFTSGIAFTFPAGTVLSPGSFIVVAENPTAFQTEFKFAPLGPWIGSLKNDGEKITLENSAGEVMDEVDYGVGFPWPTAPHGSGASMELLHSGLDNDLGGSWRGSRPRLSIPVPQTLITSTNAEWRYRKGTNEPAASWRSLSYEEDSTWVTAQTAIGFGIGGNNTVLDDMKDRYASIYLRRPFVITGQIPAVLQLNLNIDDGAVAWINGVEVARFNVSESVPEYSAIASGATEPAWQSFILANTGMLMTGTNILAIHALNQSLGSGDFMIDAELRTPDANSLGGRPTPGASNSVAVVLSSYAPPQIRQVEHTPAQPTNGQVVLITARITDPDGIGSATLSYQIVEPGQYIRKNNPAYATNWIQIPMSDNGSNGDALSSDGMFTAQLPGTMQANRRLIRYRIAATDRVGNFITVPYADDESPNFAYFVYNGVPAWRGASRPGTTPALEFPVSLMNSLPTYHLLATATDVSNSQWNSSFDTVRMWGTLVYDGEVYDHIQFHNRGEFSTYNTGKNKWRFHFNRARNFKARNESGRRYKADWTVMNFDACASPWASVNRGMAGLDEAISYRLYELAGVPSPKTHYLHFRVIDHAVEANATNQYEGDLWGLYQAIEQPNGRFLDERDLPDGNVYKIESGGGDKKNQGPTQPVTASDWNAFLNASRGSQTEQWWRTNMNMPLFYSFHAMNRVCANIDLRHGSNHYFYHHPDNRWIAIPWDMDMMFMPETHWPGIIDQNNALLRPGLALEFKNRCREILDLMCSDATESGGQVGQLVDEYSDIVNPQNVAVTWADVDECMWNWNPRTTGANVPNGQVNHKGNFYRTPYTDTRMGGNWIRTLATPNHEGFAKFLRDFCTDTDPNAFAVGDGDQRGYGFNYLELEARDAAIPNRPSISYSGALNFPANALRFRCSEFSDPQGWETFGAMKWRIAEIYNPSLSNYVAGDARKYELETVWESADLTNFNSEITLPVTVARPGSTYRARVRVRDNTLRWSHWSEPIQFTVASAEVTGLTNSLVISEFNYDPAPPTAAEAALGFTASDFEFIELRNISSQSLDLTGVRFTKGVDFNFPDGTNLGPGGYALVVRNASAFASRYGANLPVFGSYGPDNLANEGEELKLTYGAGSSIRVLTYNQLLWPSTTVGRSLVLVAPGTNPNHADPLNWRPSIRAGGTPGSSDSQSFEDWKTLHNVSSDTDDSDQDGLNAFVEYAIGSSPIVADSQTFPVFSLNAAERRLEISLRRSLRADDARFSIDTSTDLQSWSPNPDFLSSRSVTGEAETLRYSVPIQPSESRRFLRVKLDRH
jgi:hypothetical protein